VLHITQQHHVCPNDILQTCYDIGLSDSQILCVLKSINVMQPIGISDIEIAGTLAFD
jgi:hypothetical protein